MLLDVLLGHSKQAPSKIYSIEGNFVSKTFISFDSFSMHGSTLPQFACHCVLDFLSVIDTKVV
jgi:hypothetical protein